MKSIYGWNYEDYLLEWNLRKADLKESEVIDEALIGFQK